MFKVHDDHHMKCLLTDAFTCHHIPNQRCYINYEDVALEMIPNLVHPTPTPLPFPVCVVIMI